MYAYFYEINLIFQSQTCKSSVYCIPLVGKGFWKCGPVFVTCYWTSWNVSWILPPLYFIFSLFHLSMYFYSCSLLSVSLLIWSLLRASDKGLISKVHKEFIWVNNNNKLIGLIKNYALLVVHWLFMLTF